MKTKTLNTVVKERKAKKSAQKATSAAKKTVINSKNISKEKIDEGFKNPFGMSFEDTPKVKTAMKQKVDSVLQKLREKQKATSAAKKVTSVLNKATKAKKPATKKPAKKKEFKPSGANSLKELASKKGLEMAKLAANRSPYPKLEESKGASFIKTRFKYKFTKIYNVPLSEIKTDEKIFQGRTVPFAEETVNKIAREGYDTTYEPIVLWKNEKTNESIVISGHSRFEAAKRYSKKVKNFNSIPVKYFNGDLDEAIDFAVIESNRSGNPEGIESDIKAYVRSLERGYNREFLRSIFKTDSYIGILRNLANLNPKGRFVEILAKGADKEAKSFPYLLRNAGWVGALRSQHEVLTDAHELEIFNFLYKSKKGLNIKKQSFFDLISKKVEASRFSQMKGLRLENEREFEVVKESDAGVIRLRSLETSLREFNTERYEKEKNALTAMQKGEKALAEKLLKDADGLTLAIRNKLPQLISLRIELHKEDSRLEKNGLFNF